MTEQVSPTGPSLQYGEQASLARMAAQVPMASAPTDPLAATVGPDNVPNLDDPTDRPNEPVTSGMPIGPGESNSYDAPDPDPTRRTLRAMLAAFPSDQIARALTSLES